MGFSVNYSGRRALLASRANLLLTEDEKASVPSFGALTSNNLQVARELASSSTVFAVAYLEYVLEPTSASFASAFVADVISGTEAVDSWTARMNVK